MPKKYLISATIAVEIHKEFENEEAAMEYALHQMLDDVLSDDPAIVCAFTGRSDIDISTVTFCGLDDEEEDDEE